MKQNLGNKPLIYPMPVLIITTYNEDGTANAMTAAWGGVCDYTKISIIIDKGHKTTKNLLAQKALTVSIADKDHIVQADYLGIISGKNITDKVTSFWLHLDKSQTVNAPVIDEFPLTLECKVLSYDESTERLIAEVVNTLADDSILTDDKIDLAKFNPITYDTMNHHYISLGEKVGTAFCDGKKLQR